MAPTEANPGIASWVPMPSGQAGGSVLSAHGCFHGFFRCSRDLFLSFQASLGGPFREVKRSSNNSHGTSFSAVPGPRIPGAAEKAAPWEYTNGRGLTQIFPSLMVYQSLTTSHAGGFLWTTADGYWGCGTTVWTPKPSGFDRRRLCQGWSECNLLERCVFQLFVL